MGFIVNQFLKYGINLLDKENITQDQIEYVYKKWGISVAERLVQMLEDETRRARDTLERLKEAQKKLKRS
jgi:plasmid stabilization system protein ParE